MSTQRVPIVIQRKPILLISKQGHKKSGGWYVFDKPKNEEPPPTDLRKNQRVLWCPYCGQWRVFTRRSEGDRSDCSDCFAHTDEYYVRHTNRIWYEDVPLEELRKLHIPRPTGRH